MKSIFGRLNKDEPEAPKLEKLPKAGQWWHSTREDVKGLHVVQNVGLLDEFVLCDIYYFGKDEPQSNKKVPFAELTKLMTYESNPIHPNKR